MKAPTREHMELDRIAERLRAENYKLRAALEDIVKMGSSLGDANRAMNWTVEMRSMAQSALKACDVQHIHNTRGKP